MPEELFDVVDADDRVIGQAARSEVHARGLLHRAVHVFVFDAQGRLLVQRRSAAKDEYPLCYTSSASGHVAAGETYDETAPRELEEELGLSLPLERLGKFAASPELAREHSVLYRATSEDCPRPDPHEIESVVWLTLDEIAAMLVRTPAEFSPPFRVLFGW
ncbi:MAG TPA: NUDIX domain-containing protein, partial [Planctomycetaceae bacterium]|nr:NUDIX domain-containing protein [Planctomycetaceae bacterium]